MRERISRVDDNSTIYPFLSTCHRLSEQSRNLVVHGHLRGRQAGIGLEAILFKHKLIVGGGNVGEIEDRLRNDKGRRRRFTLTHGRSKTGGVEILHSSCSSTLQGEEGKDMAWFLTNIPAAPSP